MYVPVVLQLSRELQYEQTMKGPKTNHMLLLLMFSSLFIMTQKHKGGRLSLRR